MHWLKSFQSRALFGAVVVIITFVGLSQYFASPPTSSPTSSALAPGAPKTMAARWSSAEIGPGAFDTPFFNATEEPVRLNTLKGEGLIVNFWATWCAPCVREMPALDRLSKALAGHGVRVIAISEDRKALKAVPAFYAKQGIENLPLYYDVKGALSRKLGVSGLPTTVLINADGTYKGQIIGIIEWDSPEVVDYLIKALAP